MKIGDVAPLTGGFAFQSGQFKTSGVPIIRISNILSSGIVGGDFVYYNEFKGDSEFRLYKGDVVIAMSGATTGKVATFEANDFGYQNQRVGKFSRTNLVNYELLSKLVSAPNFQKKIISKLTSSAQPNASSKDIDSIDLVVPEETEEQRALASYFTSLDAQIAASTSRLSSLKQIKAASLLNMFPQKGETVPRVRFKGFQGEWVRQRLGDISASFSGGTPAVSVSDYYGGNIPFIRSGEIHENRTQLYITQAGLNNSSAKIVEKGTILYALYGATSGDVGISKLRGAINQAILAIEPTKDIDNFFLAGFLQSYKNRIINELLQGGQGNLSGSLVKKILLAIPSLSEQRAIASYFTVLDAQITLHRERLEKLKQIKAACLEKMFA